MVFSLLLLFILGESPTYNPIVTLIVIGGCLWFIYDKFKKLKELNREIVETTIDKPIVSHYSEPVEVLAMQDVDAPEFKDGAKDILEKYSEISKAYLGRVTSGEDGSREITLFLWAPHRVNQAVLEAVVKEIGDLYRPMGPKGQLLRIEEAYDTQKEAELECLAKPFYTRP